VLGSLATCLRAQRTQLSLRLRTRDPSGFWHEAQRAFAPFGIVADAEAESAPELELRRGRKRTGPFLTLHEKTSHPLPTLKRSLKVHDVLFGSSPQRDRGSAAGLPSSAVALPRTLVRNLLSAGDVLVNWASRGGRRVVNSRDKYRRMAAECSAIARNMETKEARSALIEMARVWGRLASTMTLVAADPSQLVVQKPQRLKGDGDAK
jgi:hypothetical protein